MSTSGKEFKGILTLPPLQAHDSHDSEQDKRDFTWRGDTTRLRRLEYKCKMHELIIQKIFQRITNFVTQGEVEGALVLRENVKQDIEKLLNVQFHHFKERLEDIADKNYVEQSLAQKISKEEWMEHMDQQSKMSRLLDIALAKYQKKDKQTQCDLPAPGTSLAERYQELIDQMDIQQSTIIEYEEEVRDLNWQLTQQQNRIHHEQQLVKTMHNVTKKWTSIKEDVEREMQKREREVQQKLERIAVDVYERCEGLVSSTDKQFAKLAEFEEYDPRKEGNFEFWKIIEKNLNRINSLERSMLSAKDQQKAVENLYKELMDISKSYTETQKLAFEEITELKTTQEQHKEKWEQASEKIDQILHLQTWIREQFGILRHMDFARVKKCCEEYKVLRGQVKSTLTKQTKDKDFVVKLAVNVKEDFKTKMETIKKDNRLIVKNLRRYGNWITEIGNVLHVPLEGRQRS